MRTIILFVSLLLCSCATTIAQSTSLDSFAKTFRQAYEKNDYEWLLKQSDTNSVPAELLAAQQEMLKNFFATSQDMKVTSVETFDSTNYKPFAAPGQLNGRKLRFTTAPTHWIVLKAETPLKDKNVPASQGHIKLELALYEKGGQWRIAQVTYADLK